MSKPPPLDLEFLLNQAEQMAKKRAMERAMEKKLPKKRRCSICGATDHDKRLHEGDEDDDYAGGGAGGGAAAAPPPVPAATPEVRFFQEIGFFSKVDGQPGQLGWLWNGRKKDWATGGYEERTHKGYIGEQMKYIQNLTDTLFRTSFKSDASISNVPTVDEIRAFQLSDDIDPKAIEQGTKIIQDFYEELDDRDRVTLEKLKSGWESQTDIGKRIQMAAEVFLDIAKGGRAEERGLRWNEEHYENMHHAMAALIF